MNDYQFKSSKGIKRLLEGSIAKNIMTTYQCCQNAWRPIAEGPKEVDNPVVHS